MAAGFGAAVEWHQDWAFYPHTNDDLAAVGVMMDDLWAGLFAGLGSAALAGLYHAVLEPML